MIGKRLAPVLPDRPCDCPRLLLAEDRDFDTLEGGKERRAARITCGLLGRFRSFVESDHHQRILYVALLIIQSESFDGSAFNTVETNHVCGNIEQQACASDFGPSTVSAYAHCDHPGRIDTTMSSNSRATRSFSMLAVD